MGSSNGRLRLMRRNNRARIMLAIRRHGVVSRADLAKATGLGLPCVCSIVDELLNDKVIMEVGSVAAPRGRPTTLLSVDPDGPPVSGIWLAPETTEIAVATAAGELVARRTIPCDPRDDAPETAIPAIAQGIRCCAEAAGREVSALRGVGVTVAGLVNPLIGVIESMRNRPGWNGVPVVRQLEDCLGVPVYLDNDVRAGALAYHWFHEEGQASSTIYLLVCDGIGAAVLSNHQMLSGAHEAAGVLGEMVVYTNGHANGLDERRSLESVASDIAFIHYIWPEKGENASDLTATERVELVRRGVAMALSGDERANWALSRATRYLGIAVANVSSVLDPQRVFVCGTLVDAAPDKVLGMIRQEAMQCIFPKARGVEIRPLLDYEEFLLHGSIGLVQWQPYRTLGESSAAIGSLVRTKRPSRISTPK